MRGVSKKFERMLESFRTAGFRAQGRRAALCTVDVARGAAGCYWGMGEWRMGNGVGGERLECIPLAIRCGRDDSIDLRRVLERLLAGHSWQVLGLPLGVRIIILAPIAGVPVFYSKVPTFARRRTRAAREKLGFGAQDRAKVADFCEKTTPKWRRDRWSPDGKRMVRASPTFFMTPQRPPDRATGKFEDLGAKCDLLYSIWRLFVVRDF